MGKRRAERARFGKKLKRLRELKGDITQDELARKSGVSVDLIRNYEQGKSFAKDETLEALASMLDVSPGVFQACKLDGLIDVAGERGVDVAAHLLFQMSDAYGVRPYIADGFASIYVDGGYVEYALCAWADAVEADGAELVSSGVQEACTKSCSDGSGNGAREDSEPDCADSDKACGLWFACDDPFAASDVPAPHEEWFLLNFNEPFEADECRPIELLPDRLRRLRKQGGLSQEELAQAAGISVFSLRSYEQGRRSLNDAHRQALARVFDVAPEALIDFDIPDPCTAAHYLFETAHLFDLKPHRVSSGVAIASAGAGDSGNTDGLFERFLRAWDQAFRMRGDSANEESYRLWTLRYGLGDERR